MARLPAVAPIPPPPSAHPRKASAQKASKGDGLTVPPGIAGPLEALLWVDRRCVAVGMHGLDPWWIDAFRGFYLSRRLIFVARVGLRGGKSASVCRALVADALFQARDLDPGVDGVVPVMSTDRTEATDRFVTIKAILRACGVSPAKGEDDAPGLPGGLDGEYESTTSPAGGGVIRTHDRQGHRIEFRILPAKKTAAIGYTGTGGFFDEVAMWRDKDTGANPADAVLDLVWKRYTTTIATSRVYVVSADYGSPSAHSRMVDDGDTDLQYVARLGPLGARRDDAARASLAKTDKRLGRPADPSSPNVAAWVTSPKAPIATCLALCKGNVGRMLNLYGGQPTGEVEEEEGAGDWAVLGVEHRNADCMPLDRWAGMGPYDAPHRRHE